MNLTHKCDESELEKNGRGTHTHRTFSKTNQLNVTAAVEWIYAECPL